METKLKRFFIVCPVGFEKMLAQELREVWPLLLERNAQPQAHDFPELKMLKGGIEFETEDFLGFQLNFFLKIPSRILLRLAEFKARDFPKLHDKIKKIPWQEYFHSSAVEFKVAAAGSRLNNEKRLEETLRKTLADILPAKKGGEIEGQIYLRMQDDLCTLSLDTSGEHLHKRGWGILKGEAPLRETIATFILRTLSHGVSDETLSQITLFDPMVGSGTFLTEARASNAPQFSRPFAFQKFKSCPKLFLSPQFAFNYKIPVKKGFKAFRGSDVDQEMVEVSTENFRQLESQLQKWERKNFKSADCKILADDVFGAEPPITEGPLWIVTNPPYGERLNAATEDGLADYAEALVRLKPAKLAFLYPEKSRLRKPLVPASYKISAEIPILNGGLKTFLTILEPKSFS
jgi:putative N6-adenine-specific DNA methylase